MPRVVEGVDFIPAAWREESPVLHIEPMATVNRADDDELAGFPAATIVSGFFESGDNFAFVIWSIDEEIGGIAMRWLVTTRQIEEQAFGPECDPRYKSSVEGAWHQLLEVWQRNPEANRG